LRLREPKANKAPSRSSNRAPDKAVRRAPREIWRRRCSLMA
jgi:hypothetical protein